MPDRKFDLGDYIEVKDRIARFYELYGQGRLVTGEVTLTSEPDNVPRVMVQAFAYRSPDDPHPGVGYSWMELPGKTTYTKGSELENTETSAWGRAIASLGILVDKSIASAQEVANKEGGKDHSVYGGTTFQSDKAPDGGLIGTAEIGKARDSDFELRKSGDDEHFALGFKLKSNGGGFKVLTRDELALQLLDVKDAVVGKRVTVFGRVRDETYTPKNSGRAVTYQVIDAERIKTEAGTLPVMPRREEEPKEYKPTREQLERQLEYARAEGKDIEAASLEREIAAFPIPVAEGQESLFDQAESDRLDAEEAARSA